MNLLGSLLLLALAGAAAAQSEPRTLWTYSAFDKVTGLALPPNATYVAAQGGALTLLDAQGTPIRSQPVGLIQRFASAPNGTFVATVAGLETTLRDSSFSPLWTHRGETSAEAVAVAAAAFRTAVGAKGGTLILLDRQGRPVAGKRLDGPVGALALSDDGETLAVSTPGQLLLLDGRGEERWRLTAESPAVLAISGDGSRVALGEANGRVRLVDREGSERWSHPRDPPIKVSAVAISGNGAVLLAAWGNDVAAFGREGEVLWRQTLIQPVEAVALSREGSRAAVAIRGGLVYAQTFDVAERPRSATLPSNSTPAAPAPAAPAPAPSRPRVPPSGAPPSFSPPLPLLAAGAGAALLGALILLQKRGLIALPGWERGGKGLRSLPRRLAALRRPGGRGPGTAARRTPGRSAPPPPRRGPATPAKPVARTPPLPPGSARLLRERARQEKTLENLDYMRGRGLLPEERYAALREETMAKLKEIRRRLEEAGFKE